MQDADAQRAEMLQRWERAARGWGARADRLRAFGMPVSEWLIDHLALQPGHRVLELAAGPGDTGFLAAELVRPGGVLVCSDVAEQMLEVARERAGALGLDNVEFARLELEWIDLPTASVDAVLCRWGMMLALDPDTALREARRVLRPGGRIALSVWDAPAHNQWAAIPTRALVELGHMAPPDPTGPGIFALASSERLADLLHGAGFAEVVLDTVELERPFPDIGAFIDETTDLSRAFADAVALLSDEERDEMRRRIASLAGPFTAEDGRVTFPGRALVAAASA